MIRLYRWIANRIFQWRRSRYIKQLRQLGIESEELPSLEGYDDEAIIESLRRYKRWQD